jgi:hypothetical protein
MPALDAVRPPRQVKKPVAAKPNTLNQTKKPEVKKNLKPQTLDISARKKLLWFLVLGTTLVIFLAWLFVFPGPKTKNANMSYLESISAKLSDLWQTIKTDLLKLDRTVTNSNVNDAAEEKIKNLEDRVFPQFNDPTKQ